MSDKLRFGEILVRAGALAREALERALRELGDGPADLGETLVAWGLLDEKVLLDTVGKALNLPCVSLESLEADPRALALVPREFCTEHFLIPVEVERSRSGEHLHLAMANPTDVQAIKAVTRQARLRIRPLVASGREIRQAIVRFYGGPELAGPPAPSAKAGIPGAGGEAVFDFGVADLSTLQDQAFDPSRMMGRPAPAPAAPRAPLPSRTVIIGAPPAGFGLPPVPPRPEASLPPVPPRPEASLPPVPPRPPLPTLPEIGRRLDADLVDALDSSARASLVQAGGPARTQPVQRPAEGFGMLARSRRRRSNPPGEVPAELEVTAPVRPLPALPPGLSRATGPLTLDTPRNTGSLSPALSPEPRLSEPDLIDERAPDLRGILDRLVGAAEDAEPQADQVIAEYLERFGKAPAQDADELFTALSAALGRSASPSLKLLLTLVRHLARRGLVDLGELARELGQA